MKRKILFGLALLVCVALVGSLIYGAPKLLTKLVNPQQTNSQPKTSNNTGVGKENQPPDTSAASTKVEPDRKTPALIVSGIATICATVYGVSRLVKKKAPNPPNPNGTGTPTPPPKTSNWIGRIVRATLALALVGVVGWWLYHYGGAATSTIYTATTGLQTRGAYARETTKGGQVGYRLIQIGDQDWYWWDIPTFDYSLQIYTDKPLRILLPNGEETLLRPLEPLNLPENLPNGSGRWGLRTRDPGAVASVKIMWAPRT